MAEEKHLVAKSGKARRRRGRKGDGGGVIKDDEHSERNASKNVAIAKKEKGGSESPKHHNQDRNKKGSTSAVSSLSYKPHKSVLINLTEQAPTWYDCGKQTAGRNDTIFTVGAASSSSHGATESAKRVRRNPPDLVAQYRTLAETIYQHELALFRQNETTTTDDQWVERTMKRGTLKDRIAAMSVVVSTHPVHKLYALDMLLNLAGCSTEGKQSATTNARVNQMAAEAVADLFLNTLLPHHRKLVSLDLRPLYLYSSTTTATGDGGGAKRTLSPRLLLLWHYETLIKAKYASFISGYLSNTLNSNSQLNVVQKIFALRTCCDLLKDLPEGEAQLLNIIVNKLGDPSKKVASAAGHQLRGVLECHPTMIYVVAREVQQLAHRPHLSPRALYNCIIFLNQLKLTREDDDDDDSNKNINTDTKGRNQNNHNDAPWSSSSSSLAASLVNTYFRLFEVAVQSSSTTKNTSGQRHKKEDATPSSTSKETIGMKSRLLSALLTGVNRAHPYLPRKDQLLDKHIDTLYKIAHTAPPSASTQALMLLFHLAVGSGDIPNRDEMRDGGDREIPKSSSLIDKRKDNDTETSRADRFYRALYSTLASPEMLASGKKHLTLYFNLLYKSMKYDPLPTRVVAFGKRLLCTALHCNSAVMAGGLFLLSEVGKFQPGLERGIGAMSSNDNDDKEGGSMVRWDASKREPKASFIGVPKGSENTVRSDFSKPNEEGRAVTEVNSNLLAGSLWELSLLSQHYHPTVTKFTTDLGSISYKGDPLHDFTLVPLLNKFAYRNPKSVKRITTRMQRGRGVGVRRSGIEGEMEALTSLPVNDPNFWRVRASEGQSVKDGAGVERVEFFRKFFEERDRRDKLKGIDRTKAKASSAAGGGVDVDEEDIGQEALDMAEEAQADQDIPEDWDTDSDEEKFADRLAEKLMENAADGKAYFDDEDPDMEGWDDFDDDDDVVDASDDDQEENDLYSSMDGLDDKKKNAAEGNESGSDDDESVSGAEGKDSGDGDDDAFMDADSSDSEEDSEAPDGTDPFDKYGGASDEEESDLEEAKFLIGSESDSDVDDADVNVKTGARRKGPGRDKSLSKLSESFADVSEYEKVIEQGWDEMGVTARDAESVEDSEIPEGDASQKRKRSSNSDSQKRRVRRKKRRKG